MNATRKVAARRNCHPPPILATLVVTLVVIFLVVGIVGGLVIGISYGIVGGVVGGVVGFVVAGFVVLGVVGLVGSVVVSLGNARAELRIRRESATARRMPIKKLCVSLLSLVVGGIVGGVSSTIVDVTAGISAGLVGVGLVSVVGLVGVIGVIGAVGFGPGDVRTELRNRREYADFRRWAITNLVNLVVSGSVVGGFIVGGTADKLVAGALGGFVVVSAIGFVVAGTVGFVGFVVAGTVGFVGFFVAGATGFVGDVVVSLGDDKAATRITEWAIRLLPVEERARYRNEFSAELSDLQGEPWRRQVGYGLRLLAHSVQLRRALRRPRQQDW